jgi:hemolysin activation/secretion protein
LFTILLPAGAFAQRGPYWMWEPEFSYTRKLGERWSANGKVAVQQTFNEPAGEDEEARSRYQINYTMVQLFGTYNLRPGTQLTGGYAFRFNDLLDAEPGREHRIMEQLTFLKYLGGIRLTHRFRAEQRFQDQSYTNRWRYRFAYEIPLQGDRLDPGEQYLITSNEVLLSFNAHERSGANRLYLGVGWYFSKERKLEAGVQYRLNDIGTGELENAIWFTTAYYLNR